MSVRKTHFAEHMDDPDISPDLLALMQRIGSEVEVLSWKTEFGPSHVVETETVKWADGSIHTAIQRTKRGYYYAVLNKKES